jgi:hypothetical protein
MNSESNDRTQIEFIGGPYDGFEYAVPMPLLPPSNIALPVSETIQRMLTGDNTSKPTLTTSVAIYRFDRGRCRYRFLGSTLPETLPSLLVNPHGVVVALIKKSLQLAFEQLSVVVEQHAAAPAAWCLA